MRWNRMMRSNRLFQNTVNLSRRQKHVPKTRVVKPFHPAMLVASINPFPEMPIQLTLGRMEGPMIEIDESEVVALEDDDGR